MSSCCPPRPVDPDRYIPFSKATIYHQMARQDGFVEGRFMDELVRITPAGGRASYYDATHALNREARRDRVAFLLERAER
jgi:hypothetical protein